MFLSPCFVLFLWFYSAFHSSEVNRTKFWWKYWIRLCSNQFTLRKRTEKLFFHNFVLLAQLYWNAYCTLFVEKTLFCLRCFVFPKFALKLCFVKKVPIYLAWSFSKAHFTSLLKSNKAFVLSSKKDFWPESNEACCYVLFFVLFSFFFPFYIYWFRIYRKTEI